MSPEDGQWHSGLVVKQVDLTSVLGNPAFTESELGVLRQAAASTKGSSRLSNPEKQAGPQTPTIVPSGSTLVFSGVGWEPKLKAAAALAHETGQPLYRVSTANIVSRYIGETEKNLAQVFKDVEDSGAILFFDEADSLFGKRTELKDSHDRYANVSAEAFLKARSAFDGTVILDASLQPAAEEGGPSTLGCEVRFPLSGEA